MITKTATTLEHITWQKELSNSFRNPQELLDYLGIKDFALPNPKNNFGFLVTRHFASLMRKNDDKDPLFLQVIPQKAENIWAPNFVNDPVEDKSFNYLPGLIQKYQNRCLLIGAPSCAINCRYCFRRNFAYSDNFLTTEQIANIVDYIQNHENINEVILSGGDPMLLKDEKLEYISNNLQKIKHVKRLRIHTRMPVVLPNRIEEKTLTWLKKSNLKNIIVLHVNHANEVSTDLAERVKALKNAGVLVLNQSVFLKGVNDTADALVELNESLFAADILPYYLNLLDKVSGSSHFYVEDSKAIQIYSQAAKRLSGFMLPKLVRDMGNNSYKQIISPLLQ